MIHPPIGLSNTLKEAISRSRQKERKLGVVSASDLGYRSGLSSCRKYIIGCSRLLYYRLVGFPPVATFTPQERFRLDVGTAVHELVQRYFQDYMGDKYKPEVKITAETSEIAQELHIYSTADAIYDVGPKCVQEIKTISSGGFAALNAPKPEHLTQLQTYMGCLRIEWGTLFYIGLESALPIKEYIVPFDRDHFSAVVKKVREVVDCAWTNPRLPRKEGSDYTCSRCRYQDVCAADDGRDLSKLL